MSDLEDFRPGEYEELGADALHILLSAVELVPLVGPTAARSLDYAVNRRGAANDRRFRVTIIDQIRALWEQLDNRPPIEDVIDSDRFIATVNTCIRAASETTSESKRARLAQAAASAVLPSTFTSAEIDSNLRYVEQYTDLHVWLLAFYCDPVEWLRANGAADAADDRIKGGRRDEPVNAALGPGFAEQRVVQDAIEDLQRDMMLGTFSLDETVGDRRQYAPQTRERGRSLLAFIQQDAVDMPVPGVS